MRRFPALFLCGLLAFNAQGYAKTGKGGVAGAPQVQGINIASGVRAPGWNGSATLGGGTNTTQNMESQHTNETSSSLTSLAVIYSGWLTTFTNGNEAANGNPFTITSSIEYPLGTFNRVTWNGRTSLLMAPGANIVSDYIALSTPIPAGATFYIRTFTSVSSTLYSWPSSGALANNEVAEVGVGLTDKTMGGTISGSAQGFRPSAIVAPAASFPGLISLVGIGDSIIAGASDIGFDGHGNTGWLGRTATADNTPFIQIAVTGTTLANQIGHFAYRPDLLQKAGITHAVIDWGVNDVTGGTTLPNLETEMATIATAVSTAGAKPVWTTITPRTTSTQNWSNTTSQTIAGGFTGGLSSIRSEFNAYLRTKPTPLFDFVENSWTVESSPDSCIWGTNPGLGTNSLAVQDSWTISGTPTTTVFQSNSTRSSTGTSYYNSGRILFTSGVNSGVYTTVSAYTSTNGQFTVPALSSAPAAGDTFIAYPIDISPTNDGTHPAVNLNPNSAAFHGGIPELVNNFTPQLTGWR